MRVLALAQRTFIRSAVKKKNDGDKGNPFTKKNVRFESRIGLAAGMDKNAMCVEMFEALGFGFVEVGTVTPKPQVGNPKPRLFRLERDTALINKMGFNNIGIEGMIKKLKRTHVSIPIGINIGKNKITPNEEAASDYEKAFEALYEYGDYFVVNISSPNTPDLRSLQSRNEILEISNRLLATRSQKSVSKPILIKLAPDMNIETLNILIDTIKEVKIDGVVLSNTTIDRTSLKTPHRHIKKIGNGGLSGPMLHQKSLKMIKVAREKLGREALIIGVGGINKPETAYEKICAGADLVQIYTGFVYEGPKLISSINAYLKEQLKK